MSIGIIQYAGLDQIQAIREGLLGALNGLLPVPVTYVCDPKERRRWVLAQGVKPEYIDERFPESAIVDAFARVFGQKVGKELDELARRSDAPDEKLFDIGAKRSGAGWQDRPNFVITSAFVRLLGAGEQFELDVLKSLFYYRPSGLLGNPTDNEDIRAETNVLTEEPKTKGDSKIYKMPAVWTWLRKHAENQVERARIFKNVFDIEMIPKDFTSKMKVAWYEKRNAIAHGREGVMITLAEYIEVEVFLAKTMQFISEQCREKQRLII